jgi:uncharacterized repeat protein (TIGR04076 family)
VFLGCERTLVERQQEAREFQVRATVVAFLGNDEISPCHFQHKVGDQVVFDGESCHGRLCPDVWSRIVPKVEAMHQMGPRYAETASYYPFWYCSLSVPAPEMKKYDGLGFKKRWPQIRAAQWRPSSRGNR